MKNTAKQSILEIVREEKRTGRVLENREVLDYIPELFDTIRINGAYVEKYLIGVMDEDSQKFTDTLLNMLGFRLIRTNTIQRKLEMTERAPKILEALLSVEHPKLQNTVKKIADALEKTEQENKEKGEAQLNKNNDLVLRIEDLEKANAKLESEHQQYIDTMLTGLQDMLGEPLGEAAREKICELLMDIGIEVRWPSEDGKDMEPYMFNTLTTEKKDLHKDIPCFLKKEKVVLRGVHFKEIQKAEEKEECTTKDE